MKSKLIAAVILAIIIAAFAASRFISFKQQEPVETVAPKPQVTVGIILPLSGREGAVGKGLQAAARLAIDDLPKHRLKNDITLSSKTMNLSPKIRLPRLPGSSMPTAQTPSLPIRRRAAASSTRWPRTEKSSSLMLAAPNRPSPRGVITLSTGHTQMKVHGKSSTISVVTVFRKLPSSRQKFRKLWRQRTLFARICPVIRKSRPNTIVPSRRKKIFGCC